MITKKVPVAILLILTMYIMIGCSHNENKTEIVETTIIEKNVDIEFKSETTEQSTAAFDPEELPDEFEEVTPVSENREEKTEENKTQSETNNTQSEINNTTSTEEIKDSEEIIPLETQTLVVPGYNGENTTSDDEL